MIIICLTTQITGVQQCSNPAWPRDSWRTKSKSKEDSVGLATNKREILRLSHLSSNPPPRAAKGVAWQLIYFIYFTLRGRLENKTGCRHNKKIRTGSRKFTQPLILIFGLVQCRMYTQKSFKIQFVPIFWEKYKYSNYFRLLLIRTKRFLCLYIILFKLYSLLYIW